MNINQLKSQIPNPKSQIPNPKRILTNSVNLCQLNQNGQSLITTIIGIIILGAIGLSTAILAGTMYKVDSSLGNENSKQEIIGIIDNLTAEVQNHPYKKLVPDYDNKTRNIDNYIIKLSTETMKPCGNKGARKNICDFTRVSANIYDKNNRLVASTDIDRAFTHYLERKRVYFSGFEESIPIGDDLMGITYKLWGAGGGGGGQNYTRETATCYPGVGCPGSSGGAGGGAGYVYGSREISPEDTWSIKVVVGEQGYKGRYGIENAITPTTVSGMYGAGGAGAPGAGLGGGNYSGAGGSGGGRSSLFINDIEVATAGGGGGGGGGSARRVGLIGSNCSSQTTTVNGEAGTFAIWNNGGGGGGGGGGHYGGTGGIWGSDDGRQATGGCYGGSYSNNLTDIILNPSGVTPANVNDLDRNSSGQSFYWGNASNGNVILYIAHEITATI